MVEAKANARWSLDFVHDQRANGRRFRILNVVGDVTRECLAAIPDTSTSGVRVARRGRPGLIVSDNGTEFTSNTMFAWAHDQGIAWHDDYNQRRPHSALNYLTRAAYAANLTATGGRLQNPDHLRRPPVATTAPHSVTYTETLERDDFK